MSGLRPIRHDWKHLPHGEKMARKAEARAALAAVWNQTARARNFLDGFNGFWRHVRAKHGVGSRAVREAA
jgi:hypothetical protein